MNDFQRLGFVGQDQAALFPKGAVRRDCHDRMRLARTWRALHHYDASLLMVDRMQYLLLLFVERNGSVRHGSNVNGPLGPMLVDGCVYTERIAFDHSLNDRLIEFNDTRLVRPNLRDHFLIIVE